MSSKNLGGGGQPSQAGAPSKTSSTARKIRRPTIKYADDATRVDNVASGGGVAGADGAVGASAFPTRLYKRDKSDDIKDLKSQLVQASGGNGNGPFGQIMMTDDDVKWIQRKRDMQQRAHFELWLSKTFDLSNPVHVQMLERVYPEYFSRRLAKLEEDAELQKRLAKMRIHNGAVDKEDMMLLYAIQSGQVKVPNAPLWRPEASYPVSDELQRGLFSPMKLLRPSVYPQVGGYVDLPKYAGDGGNSVGFAPPPTMPAGNLTVRNLQNGPNGGFLGL